MPQLAGNAYYAYFASQLGGDGPRTISRWTDGSRGLTPLGGREDTINPLVEEVVRHGASVYNVLSPPNTDINESESPSRPKNNQTRKKIKTNDRIRQIATSQRGKGSGAASSSQAPAVEHRTASRIGRPTKRPRQGKPSVFPAQSLIRDIFSP